jgi:casein kinase II subunit beta
MSEESDFSDDAPMTWIQWFCNLDDHQFFCEINEEYIKQPLNLYGLSKRITKYKYLYKSTN